MNYSCFEEIDMNFINECDNALKNLSYIQMNYGKNIDTLINEYHDAKVAKYLGFNCVNVNKHGFDCKYDTNSNIFLESKVSDFNSICHKATFNDTTFEKANLFKDKNVYIALSVWENISDCMCIVYGNNPKVGEYLYDKVQQHYENNTIRSTQTISFMDLVIKYGYKILSVKYPVDVLYDKLVKHSKTYKKLLDKSMIVSMEKFHFEKV